MSLIGLISRNKRGKMVNFIPRERVSSIKLPSLPVCDPEITSTSKMFLSNIAAVYITFS